MKSLRRALLTAAAILVLLVLAGATYQGAATALERREFRHPGRLVDAGGHQLHIYCIGEGSPTVVLEAPAAAMSAAWGWVQPAVAELTRVCSYDRAGLGWSEAGDRPFEPAAVPEQLHALLQQAEEPGPYIVAGQGLGAAFAGLYAAQFGADVAAVLLVDPPAVNPDAERTPVMRLVNASPWLARTGFLRVTRLMSGNAAGLPQPSAGALSSFLNRPDHLTRSARELSRWDEAVALADAAVLDPRVQVVRLDAAGQARVALLADEAAAGTTTAALAGLVETLRVSR